MGIFLIYLHLSWGLCGKLLCNFLLCGLYADGEQASKRPILLPRFCKEKVEEEAIVKKCLVTQHNWQF